MVFCGINVRGRIHTLALVASLLPLSPPQQNGLSVLWCYSMQLTTSSSAGDRIILQYAEKRRPSGSTRVSTASSKRYRTFMTETHSTYIDSFKMSLGLSRRDLQYLQGIAAQIGVAMQLLRKVGSAIGTAPFMQSMLTIRSKTVGSVHLPRSIPFVCDVVCDVQSGNSTVSTDANIAVVMSHTLCMLAQFTYLVPAYSAASEHNSADCCRKVRAAQVSSWCLVSLARQVGGSGRIFPRVSTLPGSSATRRVYLLYLRSLSLVLSRVKSSTAISALAAAAGHSMHAAYAGVICVRSSTMKVMETGVVARLHPHDRKGRYIEDDRAIQQSKVFDPFYQPLRCAEIALRLMVMSLSMSLPIILSSHISVEKRSNKRSSFLVRSSSRRVDSRRVTSITVPAACSKSPSVCYPLRGGNPTLATPAHTLAKATAVHTSSDQNVLHSGLPNLGNSCYMNVVIQCLFKLTHLMTVLRAATPHNDVVKLLLELYDSYPKYSSDLLRRLFRIATMRNGWSMNHQQDPHEFLYWLHGEFPTTVQQLMMTETTHQVSCTTCHTSSHVHDAFSHWMVPAHNATAIQESVNCLTVPKPQVCSSHHHAVSQLISATVAPILWIMVQRLDDRGIKNTNYVYPNLRLEVHGQQYHLQGLIVHDGLHANAGHYRAYACHAAGSWFSYDDSTVTPLHTLNDLSPQVYLAVYVRSELAPQPAVTVSTFNYFCSHQKSVRLERLRLHNTSADQRLNVLMVIPPEVAQPGNGTFRGQCYSISDSVYSRTIPNDDECHLTVTFSNAKVVQAALERKWGSRQRFQTLLLHSSTLAAHADLWLPRLFATLLPALARQQWIPIKGRIYLAHTLDTDSLIRSNWTALRKWYEFRGIHNALPLHLNVDPDSSEASVTRHPNQPYLYFVVRNSTIANEQPHTVIPLIEQPACQMPHTSVGSLAHSIVHALRLLPTPLCPLGTTTRHHLVAQSSDGRLSLHTTLEQLSALFTTDQLSLLQQPSTTVAQVVHILTAVNISAYLVKLHLSRLDIQQYGAGTPAHGHCALLALHQIHQRHGTASTTGPVAGAYPDALALQDTDERGAYIAWLTYLSQTSPPSVAEAINRIKTHLESHPTSISLPYALWFNGSDFRSMQLDFPICTWTHDHRSVGACVLDYCSQLPRLRHDSYTYADLSAILSTPGNLLFAHRHFCPLPDFENSEPMLMTAFADMAATLLDHVRGLHRLVDVQSKCFDLTESATVTTLQRSTKRLACATPQLHPPSHQIPQPPTTTIDTLLRAQPPVKRLYANDREALIYPSATYIRTHQHLNALTVVRDAPAYGGRGLFANTSLRANTSLGKYGGTKVSRLHQPDTYLVQATVDGVPFTVDGTPTLYSSTDFTKLAYINEFIWHLGSVDRNAYLTNDLDVIILSDIHAGDQIFMDYGKDYNWFPVIHSLNLPRLCMVLRQVAATGGHKYADSVQNLISLLQQWSIEDLRNACSSHIWLLAFIANVLRGHLQPQQRHLHHLVDTNSFDDWVEMVLSNEVVYRNVAFRYAFHPQKRHRPSLSMVKHSADMPVVSADERRVSQRCRNHILRTPQLNSDEIERLTPYPGVTWRRRLQAHFAADLRPPNEVEQPRDSPEPWYRPSVPQPAALSTSHTTTYVDVPLTVLHESSVIELSPQQFLNLASQHTADYDTFSQHQSQELQQLLVERHLSTPPSMATPGESSVASNDEDAAFTPASLATRLTSVHSTPIEQQHDQCHTASDVQPGDNDDLSVLSSLAEDVSVSAKPPPCDALHQLPLPREESHIAHLNRTADNLAPPPKIKSSRHRWFNTYIHNVGGLHEAKMVDIANVTRAKCCDVIALLDTRLTISQTPAMRRALKQSLPGYHAVFFPTVIAPNGTRIGGAVVLTSPRVRHRQMFQLSPLGTLLKIEGSIGRSRFACYAVYIPQSHHGHEPGSLYEKVAKELRSTPDVSEDPYDHIKVQLHQHITSSLADGRYILLGGDFNTTLQADNDPHKLQELLQVLKLTTSESNVSLSRPTYVTAKASTRIDHLYTSDRAQVHMVAIHRSSQFQTDHAALIASCAIQHHQKYHTRWILPLHQIRKGRFDAAEEEQRMRVTAALSTLTVPEGVQAADRLRHYTAETMQRINTLCGVRHHKRGKGTRYWCPNNVALDVILRMVVSGLRLFKHHKWKTTKFKDELRRVELRLARLARGNTDQLQQFTLLNPFMLPFWTSLSLVDEVAVQRTLATAYVSLKQSLYLNLRKARRKEFTDKKREVELHLQTGRLRSVISYAIGSKKRAYKMETLLIDGVTVTDPGVISRVTTVHFKDWFTPKYPKTVERWLDILTNRTTFYAHARERRVPDRFIDIIWKAVSYRPQPSQQQAAFVRAVLEPPTLLRFQTALRQAPKNTAGGISGLTYDHMRHWPEHVLKDVYTACCELWTTKSIPIEWTRRWVHLIPKAADPSLDELRPICLLEVIRKLWVGLVVETISEYIYSDGVLTPGQQSGKHRGTDAGSMELTATLETAKRNRSQVYLTSWDVKRAFDSVARGILLFSWTRLGVPRSIADYLISLDAEAVMVVKNPLSILIDHEFGYQGLVDHHLVFHPQQGTPQGGNEASLGYIAFSDILLRALHMSGTDDYLVLDTSDQLHDTNPNAYVDDLNSVSATLAGLQHKAAVVSAFASILCITLNASKFRAFHINWGNSHQQAATSYITIYTNDWQPVRVQLATDGSLTHLGLTRDCDLSDVTQFHALYSNTVEALQLLTKSAVSVAAKLRILKTVIYPRIRYIGKGVNWRLRGSHVSYERLDKLIFAAVRKLTLNRVSFPTALIELAEEQGGLGIPRISIDCQLAKLADLRRAFTRSAVHQATARVLIANVLKSTNQPLITPSATIAPIANCDTWWLTSAIEFLQSIGLTLTLNHPNRRRTLPTATMLCQQHAQMSSTVRAALYLYSIATAQELFMVGDTPSLTLRTIIDDLQVAPVEYQPIPLRSDQTWLFHIDGQPCIHQLMGYRGHGQWQTVQWTSHTALTIGTTLTLADGINALLGAGGNSSISETEMFLSHPSPQLLTLSKETYRRNGSHSCQLLDMRTRTPLGMSFSALDPEYPLNSLNLTDRIRPSYQDWLANSRNTTVFTDGSFRRFGSGTALLLNQDKAVCQSSIVKRGDNGCYFYMAITNDTIRHGSAFTTELIAQVVALKYTNSIVATDCKGAIASLRTPRAWSHPLTLLAPTNQADRLSHVSAHPELVKAAKDYTPADRGIFLADAVAGGQLHKGDCYFDATHSIIVSDTEILKDLSADMVQPFVSTATGTLYLEPLLQCYRRQLHERYLQQRDTYQLTQRHVVPGRAVPWEGTSFVISAQLFCHTVGARRCQIQRMALDWHNIGRQKFKASGKEDDLRCTLCQHPTEDQSHVLANCAHPDMLALRREHWAELSRVITLQQSGHQLSPFDRACIQLHSLLTVPENYSLLFGRVHRYQHKLLDTLPTLTVGDRKRLIDRWRNYAAMAVDLYSQRQLLLNNSFSLLPRVLTSRIGARVIVAREIMLGIDPTTVIRADGTKLTNTHYTPGEVMQAHRRSELSAANSQVLATPRQTLKQTKSSIAAVAATTDIVDILKSKSDFAGAECEEKSTVISCT